MSLEGLPNLSVHHQWVYVVGRIVVESVNVDARLRALLATLNGRMDRDALREAAPQWSTTLAGCKNHLAQVPFSEKTWAAVMAVVNDADAAWNERNRYVHDLLVETIAADDQPHPDAAAFDGKHPRLRVRLASDRKGGAPDAQVVSLDQAVALVHQLVAVGWRLRGAQGHLAGATTWNDLLFGHVTGDWDGSAGWTSDEDDDN
jgi:hypothetical protein